MKNHVLLKHFWGWSILFLLKQAKILFCMTATFCVTSTSTQFWIVCACTSKYFWGENCCHLRPPRPILALSARCSSHSFVRMSNFDAVAATDETEGRRKFLMPMPVLRCWLPMSVPQFLSTFCPLSWICPFPVQFLSLFCPSFVLVQFLSPFCHKKSNFCPKKL